MTGLAFVSNSDFRALFWMNGVFMGISGVLLLWKSRQGGAKKHKKEEVKSLKEEGKEEWKKEIRSGNEKRKEN